MTGLDKRSYQQIIELLTPLMSSEADRRALIVLTFVNHPLIERIDFTGATSAFLPNLIDTLHQFGKLDDGRPALWAVLEVAREQVGLDQKHRIDALRPSFELPPPPRLDKLFVSYSRQNEIFARKLVGDLKDAGLRVWYDREKIKGGENWWQSIVNGIKAADYFVFCLSPDAIRSEVARDELLVARQHGKPIFAVMLEDCLDDLKTETFANIQWLSKLHVIDFTQIAVYGSKLRELIESLPGYTPPDTYFLDEIDPRDLPNPFRGLEAFLEVDAAYFTGRDDAVADLIGRIQDPQKPRLLAVVGASGSGKSSLVRAGLIPAIRQQLPFWDTVTIRPGSSPIDELADRLQERLGVDASGTRNRLRTESNALDDIASELLQGKPEEARFVLVIDQFEEVFTLTSSEEQDIFLQRLLASILKPNGKLYVILTLRADFFDRLSAVPELAKLVRDNLDIATEMTPDQLRRSIEDPAQKVGVVYEEGLVETILEDVRAQPGSLPLLQYALKELFERKVGRRMTHEAYKQISGVKSALANRAETIYEKETDYQTIIRRVMLRLVEVGEEVVTRRRVPRHDLAFSDIAADDVDAVLVNLTAPEARLLVASSTVDETLHDTPIVYYEVSHEALLTHWERLANWIAEDREDLRLSSDIFRLAKEWSSTDQADNSFLLRGARLFNAQEWLQRNDSTELQHQFIEASIAFDNEEKQRELELQQRAANRLRYLLVAVIAFMIIGGLLMGIAYFSQQNAQQANLASSSLGIAADALLENDPSQSETVALLSIRSLRSSYSPQAELTLHRALDNLSTTRIFQQYDYRVRVVRFSPDGSQVLVASFDDTLELFDTETGELIWSIGVDPVEGTDMNAGPVVAAEFSYSGEQILISYTYIAAISIDAQTGAYNASYIPSSNRPLRYTTYTRTSVTFSPDDQFVVIGDDIGYVEIFDAGTGELIRSWLAHTTFISALQFSKDGTILYSSSGDRSIKAWRLDQDDPIQIFVGHNEEVMTIEISNDGLVLASGSADETIIIWDIQSATPIQQLEGHTDTVRDIAFSPDDLYLVSGGMDNIGRVWDVTTGEIIRLLVGHGQALDFNYFTDEDGVENPYAIWSVDFSPDGRYLVTGGWDGSARLWSLEERYFRNHTASVTSIAFSPDGRYLVTGSVDDTVQVRDLQNNQVVAVLEDHNHTILDVGFSDDNRYVYSTSRDGYARVWSVDTWQHVRYYQLGTDSYFSPDVFSADISSDNQFVAISDEISQSVLTANGEQIFRSEEANNSYEVAFSPDNNYLLIASFDDALVRIVNYLDGIDVRWFASNPPAAVWDAAFSPDGNHVALALADNTIRIFSIPEYSEEKVLMGHIGEVTALAYSPDGQNLVSGSADNMIRVWNVTDGSTIREISGHTDWILDLAYSPDGRYFASASRDGTYQLWDAQSDGLIKYACSRLFRDFTEEERIIYELGSNNACDGHDDLPSEWTPISVDGSDTHLPTIQPTTTPSNMIAFNERSNRILDVKASSDGRWIYVLRTDWQTQETNIMYVLNSDDLQEVRSYSIEADSFTLAVDDQLIVTRSENWGNPVIRTYQARTGSPAGILTSALNILSTNFNFSGTHSLIFPYETNNEGQIRYALWNLVDNSVDETFFQLNESLRASGNPDRKRSCGVVATPNIDVLLVNCRERDGNNQDFYAVRSNDSAILWRLAGTNYQIFGFEPDTNHIFARNSEAFHVINFSDGRIIRTISLQSEGLANVPALTGSLLDMQIVLSPDITIIGLYEDRGNIWIFETSTGNFINYLETNHQGVPIITNGNSSLITLSNSRDLGSLVTKWQINTGIVE